MSKNEIKRDLWYGRNAISEAWYNRPTQAPHTEGIETAWGKGTIEVKGDYCIEFRLDPLVSIHRIDYEIRCYLNLRLATEEYELQNISKRVNRIKDNGERVHGGSPTEKANAIIYATIKPALVAWVEANAQRLLAGYTLKYVNQIALARHKLDKIEEEIRQRREYLDMLDKELVENGGLSDEDKYRLNDLWGSSWTFK